MLLEHCADLAKKLIDTDPSITVNGTADTDQVNVVAEAAVNCTSTSAKTCQLATGQPDVTVSAEFFNITCFIYGHIF